MSRARNKTLSLRAQLTHESVYYAARHEHTMRSRLAFVVLDDGDPPGRRRMLLEPLDFCVDLIYDE